MDTIKCLLLSVRLVGIGTNQKWLQAPPTVRSMSVCKMQKDLLSRYKKFLRTEPLAPMYATHFVLEVTLVPVECYLDDAPKLV
jgi:hypothetical protein